ncbi:MAG: zinc ribbon domain-containing protein [Dehalococcoidia bacterium]
MPLYEYLCQSCNGIFEELRPMREAAEPVPCPECFKDAVRIMPTSFAAFTFREGYPRRIPDDGKYYHLGKKVNKRISGPVQPNEHPEINKPKPKPVKLRGEKQKIRDMTEASRKGELVDLYGNWVKPEEVAPGVDQGRVYRKGAPKHNLPKR